MRTIKINHKEISNIIDKKFKERLAYNRKKRKIEEIIYKLNNCKDKFESQRLEIEYLKLENTPLDYFMYELKEGEKFFEIWSEGYRATGEEGYACMMGIGYGKTFKEACIRFFEDNDNFVIERMTYWGCSLYDNEAQARVGFG